jgi:hypothetical protein
MILEGDATCATTIMQEIRRILPTLPADWDLLYVGGKPFSYHTLDTLSPDLLLSQKTKERLTKWACRGGLGRSATGPSAQPYCWETRYITNTRAYLVNAQWIERVLNVLDVLEHLSRDYQIPIDIALVEAGQCGPHSPYVEEVVEAGQLQEGGRDGCILRLQQAIYSKQTRST